LTTHAIILAMPYKIIRYNDRMEIEASTEREFETALAIMEKQQLSQGSSTPQGPISEKLIELFHKIGKQHMELLRYLNEHPDGVTDEELKTVFNLATRRNIGGLFMGLSKKAGPLGIDMDKYVIAKRISRDAEGERIYTFRLCPEAKEALKSL
jgi:hypothetical protein